MQESAISDPEDLCFSPWEGKIQDTVHWFNSELASRCELELTKLFKKHLICPQIKKAFWCQNVVESAFYMWKAIIIIRNINIEKIY